jgi:hypothetical protein
LQVLRYAKSDVENAIETAYGVSLSTASSIWQDVKSEAEQIADEVGHDLDPANWG